MLKYLPKIIPFEFGGGFWEAGATYNFLGKLFFRSLPPDLQRRQINILLAGLFVGLLLGGLVALMMVLTNKIGMR